MDIDLSIDVLTVRRSLIGFIRSMMDAARLSRVVVNLSGGLDSALSCALAVEALGKANVLALRLPYKTSSPESLLHAQLMIDQLQIPSLTIPITDMVDTIYATQPDMSTIRKGNIMARMRMIVGFDQSASIGGLVVGTGNKTEILLGYTTIYGDSACAFNPLGDLYKTQVRQLAREVNIPEEIIRKAPSADLWADQTDEGELGFTYEQVDKLLFLLVDNRKTPEECLEAGFQRIFVQQVIEKVRKNRFKRMLPPIAKLSNATIGMEFNDLDPWE